MINTRILARYIARKFALSIAAAFLVCVVLIFLVDFLEILRQAGKYGNESIWFVVLLTLLRLPAFAEIALVFAVLFGTIVALLRLSRTSELTVMRAAGMSVWQFLAPGLMVALALGLFAVTVYNPLAAAARAKSEQLYTQIFKRSRSLLKTKAGAWLRQDSVDGQWILNARSTAQQGLTLGGLMALQYDTSHHFVERIDARTATLRDGYWQLSDAWISRPGARTQFYKSYLIATHLTKEQVINALGTVTSISFWRLPKHIERIERAGLSAKRFRVQYQKLLAQPLMLAVMVLLGSTVSLRAFRFGRIQTMVVVGLVAGFGYFILVELSRQLGVSGITPPVIAAWVPVAMGCFMSLTALLYQEDG